MPVTRPLSRDFPTASRRLAQDLESALWMFLGYPDNPSGVCRKSSWILPSPPRPVNLQPLERLQPLGLQTSWLPNLSPFNQEPTPRNQLPPQSLFSSREQSLPVGLPLASLCFSPTDYPTANTSGSRSLSPFHSLAICIFKATTSSLVVPILKMDTIY